MENAKKLSIAQWEAKYKPIVNPNAEDECSADRFETYGKDLDYVLNVVKTSPRKVWTLEDVEGELIICAGYHFIDRMNYFITEVEWEDENIEVQYCDEDASETDSSSTEDKCFNANDYTTRQLLEIEFKSVPNGTHKDNMIDEALQLVEGCAYTVGEAANEVLEKNTSFVGLPELFSIRETFLTYVGEWSNGKECRTGENREDGTVTYLMDGLYLYEFKTREDAYQFLFDDERSIPYAITEYDEKASEKNGEETFGEWEFHNGFIFEQLSSEMRGV